MTQDLRDYIELAIEGALIEIEIENSSDPDFKKFKEQQEELNLAQGDVIWQRLSKSDRDILRTMKPSGYTSAEDVVDTLRAYLQADFASTLGLL